MQRKRSSRCIPDGNDRLAVEEQGRRIDRAVRGGDREFDASLRSPRFPAKPELHATRDNFGAGGLELELVARVDQRHGMGVDGGSEEFGGHLGRDVDVGAD